MFVTTVPNRGSPSAVLLRESYREDGKVKTRTLANLSHWPDEKVQTLRAALRGDKLVPAGRAGSKSAAPCRMAMSSPRWPPPAVSASMTCSPAARRDAGAISFSR